MSVCYWPGLRPFPVILPMTAVLLLTAITPDGRFATLSGQSALLFRCPKPDSREVQQSTKADVERRSFSDLRVTQILLYLHHSNVSLPSAYKPISHARLGDNVLGLGGMIFEFFS
jgi:hypothetical protein